MTSKKIKIVSFEGGGDDMDALLKNIMTDRSFAETESRLICGVNSYNIARPLMQMVHFIWAYLRVTEALNIQPGEPGTAFTGCIQDVFISLCRTICYSTLGFSRVYS
jgi:threonine synthase